MLRVDLSPLDEGFHQQSLTSTAEDAGLDPEIFGDVTVDVRLDVAERRVVASFEARSVATLECDRTLVHFEQPLSGSHTILFVPEEQIPPDADDDFRPLAEDDREIDLTDSVRETLLLSLPLRRVAPEAEEAEITTSFGDQEMLDGVPIDDRWEALKQLRSDSTD